MIAFSTKDFAISPHFPFHRLQHFIVVVRVDEYFFYGSSSRNAAYSHPTRTIVDPTAKRVATIPYANTRKLTKATIKSSNNIAPMIFFIIAFIFFTFSSGCELDAGASSKKFIVEPFTQNKLHAPSDLFNNEKLSIPIVETVFPLTVKVLFSRSKFKVLNLKYLATLSPLFCGLPALTLLFHKICNFNTDYISNLFQSIYIRAYLSIFPSADASGTEFCNRLNFLKGDVLFFTDVF